jgi:glycosyltransferase involved in cell wall biosynthesis
MIEAMACGTPVLAFRCGSVPEIVEDGITGAIVDTLEQAIAALPRVIALDRKKVRKRFEQRFSARRMANDYVDVYRLLLAAHERGKTEYENHQYAEEKQPEGRFHQESRPPN